MGLFDYIRALFKSKPASQRNLSTSKPISVSAWTKTDAANGISFAKICERQGRYELAAAFQEIGIYWYKREVVGKPSEHDSDFYKSYWRQCLRGYRNKLRQYPILAEIRDKIILEIGNHHDGICRSELANIIIVPMETKFGVICNQLEKGGWITQTKKGSKIFVHLPENRLLTNEDFLRTKIPAPGSSGFSI